MPYVFPRFFAFLLFFELFVSFSFSIVDYYFHVSNRPVPVVLRYVGVPSVPFGVSFPFLSFSP